MPNATIDIHDDVVGRSVCGHFLVFHKILNKKKHSVSRRQRETEQSQESKERIRKFCCLKKIF